MKFDLDKEQRPVACTSCDWEGTLSQTEDMDVLNADFEKVDSTCVCPRCGHEVKEIEQQKSAF